MIDVVGMLGWLLLGPGMVLIPLVAMLVFVGAGVLASGPLAPEPCAECRLRSLTLGGPGLVRCTHEGES